MKVDKLIAEADRLAAESRRLAEEANSLVESAQRRAREADRLAKRVHCLDLEDVPFTLISKYGFHCDVWRSIGRLITAEGPMSMDFVLKVAKHSCSVREVKVLAREHRLLRRGLEDVIPRTFYVATRIDDKPGVVAYADTCQLWFDLANPTNEVESLALLKRARRTPDQLRRFVKSARRLLDEERKLVDLFGSENLIVDRHYNVRYIDSFHVFFYMETADVIDDVGEQFRYRSDQSIQRLEYLEWLVSKLPD